MRHDKRSIDVPIFWFAVIGVVGQIIVPTQAAEQARPQSSMNFPSPAGNLPHLTVDGIKLQT